VLGVGVAVRSLIGDQAIPHEHQTKTTNTLAVHSTCRRGRPYTPFSLQFGTQRPQALNTGVRVRLRGLRTRLIATQKPWTTWRTFRADTIWTSSQVSSNPRSLALFKHARMQKALNLRGQIRAAHRKIEHGDERPTHNQSTRITGTTCRIRTFQVGIVRITSGGFSKSGTRMSDSCRLSFRSCCCPSSASG
jgi:hypothetical protein